QEVRMARGMGVGCGNGRSLSHAGVCALDVVRALKRGSPAFAGLRLSRVASDLFAHPDLLAADEGHAAGHAELRAALEQLGLGLVGLALRGVEDRAAAPFAGGRLQAPEDGHALDGLALVGAFALVAG